MHSLHAVSQPIVLWSWTQQPSMTLHEGLGLGFELLIQGQRHSRAWQVFRSYARVSFAVENVPFCSLLLQLSSHSAMLDHTSCTLAT